MSLRSDEVNNNIKIERNTLIGEHNSYPKYYFCLENNIEFADDTVSLYAAWGVLQTFIIYNNVYKDTKGTEIVININKTK